MNTDNKKIVNCLTFFLLVCLLFKDTNGCFLNSCPFRRYGRNIECDSCEKVDNGMCATDGLCCNVNQCLFDKDCINKNTCLNDQCMVDDYPGVCVFSGLCCTHGICKVTPVCFSERRKKDLRLIRRKIQFLLPKH
uniref:GRANULINS domain-containing protein n=1 Tax=Parastrongyloides trichosuri TaxID=131310 RepID=A0A0N4Z8X7_PARTI